MLCTVCHVVLLHIVRIWDPSFMVHKVQSLTVPSSYVWLSTGVPSQALSSVNRLHQVHHIRLRQARIHIGQGHWVLRYMLWFHFPNFSSVRSELHRSTSVTSSLVPIYCQISVPKYSTAVRCGYVSLDFGYNVPGCICKVPGEVHGAAWRIMHGDACRV